MNTYEERIAAKKERYEDLAARKQEQSTALSLRASRMADVIPFGQPILVGHHSERADRNYRNKIVASCNKANELSETAKYYANKAASVGTAGISSDDPDAIKKLTTKLEKLQDKQNFMKAVNKALRIKDIDKSNEALELAGLNFTQTRTIRNPDCFGNIGFASFSLTNNNAEIKRLADRIKKLSKVQVLEPVTEEHEGFEYKEADNRCQFVFEGKPSDDIRNILKHNAFKWSPTRGAWVRQLTDNGKWAAERVKEQLNTLN